MTENENNQKENTHEEHKHHHDGNCNHDHEHDPMQQLAEDFTKQNFPLLWNEHKKQLKEMSKKEIAEQMFFSGASMILNSVQQTHEKPEGVKSKEDNKTKNTKTK